MTRADEFPDGAGDDGPRAVAWTGSDDVGVAAVPAYGAESTADGADRVPAETAPHGDGDLEPAHDRAPAAERVATDAPADGEAEIVSVAPPGDPAPPPQAPRPADGVLGALRRRLAGR